MDAVVSNGEHRQVTVKLWPPSQNTRQMLVDRLTRNISTPTSFTLKYGCLDEALAIKYAKKIEESAFASATKLYEQESDSDGTSAVQLYARECSNLCLEVLKGGSHITVTEEQDTLGSKVDSAFRETFFDISKGKRAFLEENEAQTLLSPLNDPNNLYTKICFSNQSFGLGAAHVAGPILALIRNQLKEVDLSDFVAGRSEAEALDVMKIFSEALEGSQLRYLNLSDNALGEKGVRAFSLLLQSQTCLEELYLINDGISEEAARAVCELLPSPQNLRVLHFHNNMTGDEGAVAISEILKRCSLLEDFRCSSTRVGAEGGAALTESLAKCNNLKKLDIRDNMFGVEVGIKLSEAVRNKENLTEIYLSYLNLEDDGAIALANALEVAAPSLEVLEVAGNDISAKAAQSLAACIASKKAIAKLNLSENNLKDNGALLISKAFGDEHDKLKEVDLSQNSLRRAAARTLAQDLADKRGFKLLNINGNFISDEGIDELKDIFNKHPDRLGPLDENDPDGEDFDDEDYRDEDEDEDQDGQDDLEAKLKNLAVNQAE